MAQGLVKGFAGLSLEAAMVAGRETSPEKTPNRTSASRLEFLVLVESKR